AVRPPGFRTLMASGAYTDANGRVQPLVERWTGSSWVVQPVPDPGTAAELSGIELLTSGEAWAVGAYLDASSNARPLAERWNGRSWAVVSAPDPGSGYLRAVAARSIADVWAVGYSVTAGVMRTLAEHWNGASWSIISTPNATPNNNVLYGVTVSPTRIPYALSGRVLAVGFANHVGPPGAPTQQLIECYC
ncbi:MAG: hypothetical protein JOZ41_18070, partial [Chloroflexi bacterium]|nr:hypothetical protein [Chloroflexota bacterium]